MSMEKQIWYQMRTYLETFDPVEIDSYTEKMVTIKGRKNARQYDSGGYYPSKEEAKQALINYRQGVIRTLKKQLERAEENLELALRA